MEEKARKKRRSEKKDAQGQGERDRGPRWSSETEKLDGVSRQRWKSTEEEAERTGVHLMRARNEQKVKRN